MQGFLFCLEAEGEIWETESKTDWGADSGYEDWDVG